MKTVEEAKAVLCDRIIRHPLCVTVGARKELDKEVVWQCLKDHLECNWGLYGDLNKDDYSTDIAGLQGNYESLLEDTGSVWSSWLYGRREFGIVTSTGLILNKTIIHLPGDFDEDGCLDACYYAVHKELSGYELFDNVVDYIKGQFEKVWEIAG